MLNVVAPMSSRLLPSKGFKWPNIAFFTNKDLTRNDHPDALSTKLKEPS
jgi:hypothetical protein